MARDDDEYDGYDDYDDMIDEAYQDWLAEEGKEDFSLRSLDIDDLDKRYIVPSQYKLFLDEEEGEESRMEQEVDFYRPDRTIEQKDVRWCIDNGFEQVEDGLWSGPWYWKEHDKDKREPLEPIRRRLGTLTEIDPASFEIILRFKAEANAAFTAKKYAVAVSLYDRALTLYPLYYEIIPKVQMQEHVNILSNKAECLIRSQRYEAARVTANEALMLDSNHIKCLFRRAKASYRCATGTLDGFGMINPFLCGAAIEDLERIIAMKREGVADAQALLDEVNASLQGDIDRFDPRGQQSLMTDHFRRIR